MGLNAEANNAISNRESATVLNWNLEGRRVLIVGMKRSGVSAARFCASRGARIIISDSAPPESLQAEMESLRDLDVVFELGEHIESTFTAADLIVVSPGVPLTLEPLQKAKQKGAEVISELELASRFLKGRILAITGTNGKTTTTTLAGEVLQAAGFHTLVGGNIGKPLTALVDSSTEESISVLEVSSFQMEAVTSFRPDIAVILNVTPDHLDRYRSFEEYASFKEAVLRNQGAKDWAVLNADDKIVSSFSQRAPGHVWWFSRERVLDEGCYFQDDKVVVAHDGIRAPVISRGQIPLLGDHNVENCLAAISAGAILGLDFHGMARTISNFQGVEHRLEFVVDIGGVRFYNDSKATNVDAAIKAIEAFKGNLVLILGGKDKGSDYTVLAPLLRSRVKQVLLIGAASEKIERQLAGVVPLRRCGDLQHAVAEVPACTVSGDTVLLAPACASFDQFENYEHRGRVFKGLVKDLKISLSR